MRMARFAASPSTDGGRDIGCPAGPVTPAATSWCWSRNTSSPFSACTVGSAPSSRQRENEFTSVSSSHMMAFLYAMKCLKLCTPCSCASVPMSACTLSSHQVTATWKA
jgi:hypothetical protein